MASDKWLVRVLNFIILHSFVQLFLFEGLVSGVRLVGSGPGLHLVILSLSKYGDEWDRREGALNFIILHSFVQLFLFRDWGVGFG